MIGCAKGEIFSFTLTGSSTRCEGKSITSSNYNGNGTPYSSTIKSIGINIAGVIFVGTDGEGIFKLSGNTWSDCTYNLDKPSHIIAIITNKQNGKMFAISSTTGIYRSSDNGFSWDKIYSSSSTDALKCITIDPSDGAIYVGYKWGILKSLDDGNNWSQLVSTFQSPFGPTDLYNVVDLGVDGNLYALTSATLFLSKDKGNSWSEISGSVDFPAFHQFTSMALAYTIGGPSIYLGSSNTGVTYKDLSSSKPGWVTDNNSNGLNTSVIHFSKVYQNGRVYLGTSAGIYYETF